jgi:hypothetical protein
MRTLVDLFGDERGYVRIFAERDGYGYELSTYLPRPIADLFERMSGYDSLGLACEVARFQLSSTGRVRQVRARSARRRASQRAGYKPQSLPLV